MSNIIPPLLSSSPPPIVCPLDEDDDEFADFSVAPNSYDCDDVSLSPSPDNLPEKKDGANLDINWNNNRNTENDIIEHVEKDFQDKRKISDAIDNNSESKINCIQDKNNKDMDDTFHKVPNDSYHCDKIDIEDSFSQNETDSFAIKSTVDNCGAEHISSKETSKEVSCIVDTKNDRDSCVIAPKLLEYDHFGDFENHINHVNKPISKNDNLEKVNNYYDDMKCAESVDSFQQACTDKLDGEYIMLSKNDGDINAVEKEATDIPINLFNETLGNSYSAQYATSIVEDLNCSIVDHKSEIIDNLECGKFKSEDSDFHSLDVKTTSEDNSYSEHFDSPMLVNDSKSEKENTDDFGDFTSPGWVIDNSQDPNQSKDFITSIFHIEESSLSDQVESDDDFGDFESNDVIRQGNDVDDEFGDFGHFSPISTTHETKLLTHDLKNVYEKSKCILEEIFPSIEQNNEDYTSFNETEDNFIFNELKDVTETKALTYQWSKSSSQQALLKALNIDIRNILYGPTWHCTMPRFAATLGSIPLEPTKSGILTPTSVNAVHPSDSSHKNHEIPSAQFDWNSSGLINPLDYSQTILLDLEQLVGSLDFPSSTNSTSNSHQTPSPSSELDNWDIWLQSAVSVEQVRKIDEPTQCLEKISHLSQKSLDICSTPSKQNVVSDFSSCESPKFILLRETHISNENTDFSNWLEPTIVTPDLPRKLQTDEILNEHDYDADEFDDFQMVLPDTKTINNSTSLINSHEHEHISNKSILQNSQINSPAINDDDEFTDFHSSLPTTKPVQPMPMELLKPSVQYQPTTMQINWPDPGVSDDDIKNIELNYSRTNVDEKSNTLSNSNSLADEEWTDYVSAINHKHCTERTATPDLPLSVLNLNQIQPPKKPIPVITSSGLVQTKLSSNFQSSVVQTSIRPNLFKPQPMALSSQPSIISNQFSLTNMSTVSDFRNASQNNKSDHNDDADDDDWSDFVSSQPLPQTNSFEQQKSSSIWPTANIITNPGHFDTFVSQQKVPTKITATPKSIYAMPDLEIIGPKNRMKK